MIIFCHLLNDYSGSPRVLKQLLNFCYENNRKHEVYYAPGTEGFLNESKVKTNHYFYKRFDYKILTLLSYLLSQVILFFKLCLRRDKKSIEIVYVNTLMPFGAALFGWVYRIPVIWHVHEYSIRSRLLDFILIKLLKHLSKQIIFVSKHQRDFYEKKGIYGIVLPNTYDIKKPDFKSLSNVFTPELNVTMMCSNKWYKGINEFIEIARLADDDNEEIYFTLCLNGTDQEFKELRNKCNLRNIHIFQNVRDVESIYRKSHVNLNLSRVDGWIETFGLTILEAKLFGLPSIVPTSGGPLDLVSYGFDGYHMDSRNVNKIYEIIKCLHNNRQELKRLRGNSIKSLKKFAPELIKVDFLKIVDDAIKRNK